MKNDNLQKIDLTLNQLEHGLRSVYPYIQKAYRGIKDVCPNAHGAFSDYWEKQGPVRHWDDKFFRVTMATLHDKGELFVYVPTGKYGYQDFVDVWRGVHSLFVITSDNCGSYRIVVVDCLRFYEILCREVPRLYAEFPNAACKLSLTRLREV